MSERTCTGYYTGYDLEGGSKYRNPCWRNCGCELPGCPAIEGSRAASDAYRAAEKAANTLHVFSQKGQPIGSTSRCNHCGATLWVYPAPPHVDNWDDWQAAANNCRVMGNT